MTARPSDRLVANELWTVLGATALWPLVMWAICFQMPVRQCVVLEFKKRENV